jgi:Domain of unknown function (DUF1905)
MELIFEGSVWFWRGPAPFYFVTVPDEESAAIASTAELVSYGWGMIPVAVRIGKTRWSTSLWPKDGGYIVPLKVAVRRAEKIELDAAVKVHIDVNV